MFTQRLIKASLALLAAGTVAVAGVNRANAQTENGHYACFSLAGNSFFNDCTGEVILFTDGQACISETFKVDSSGGVHVSFQFKSDFTAIGLSTGTSYVEHNAAGELDNLTSQNGQYEFTFKQNYHVNTSGPKNNLYIKELFHVTIDANGNMTSVTFTDELGCK